LFISTFMSDLLLSVADATVAFNGKPVFQELTFHIKDGERICLVGRNGAGKSTLMNIITAKRSLDSGERWQLNGVKVGYLEQDVIPVQGQSVYDYVFDGLKDEQDSDIDDETFRAMTDYKVDLVLVPLEINPDAHMDQLSGGQLRRAALAKALVHEPEILLLDEPTNHLDLEIIEWLEGYLKGWRGALLVVSHDKAFLASISNRVFWLDRGRIRVSPKGFAHFEQWSQELLDQEERELRNRSKVVEREVEWATRGVKARVKRNVARVEKMKKIRDQLKQDKSSYRQATRKIELPQMSAEMSSKVIAEFKQVYKSYDEKIILDGFNFRIMRGDRIGILGRNGSGKTTFLKLLLGVENPDKGTVKLAKNLHVSYFDQKRGDLDPEKSLWRNLVLEGGEYIEVMGKDRHVRGYLKQFMFDPGRAEDKVLTLSGGQKNRLMLAKILANPGQILVLDEPTNDLDMETMEMLEEIIANYNGTLFIVSHDRDFLDQTVSQVLAFEGQGEIDHVIGGYSDYMAFKKSQKPQEKLHKSKKLEAQKSQENAELIQTKKVKLTFKDKHALEKLPLDIKKLDNEISELGKLLANPNFYNEDPKAFNKTAEKMDRKKREKDDAEIKLLELMELAEEVA
jgi:ATP-binding cassette subfamily F protein uup